MSAEIETPIRSRPVRKALQCLQYTANCQDLASPLGGGTPRKNNMFDMSSSKSFGLKKRTSISLPDISSQNFENIINLADVASSAAQGLKSTPCKLKLSSSNYGIQYYSSLNLHSTPGTLRGGRKDCSIILEEKENPSFLLELSAQRIKSVTKAVVSSGSSTIKEENLEKSYKDEGTLCKLDVEKMLLYDDELEDTSYYRLMAQKRFAALHEARQENLELNDMLSKIDEKNDKLRARNKELVDLIHNYEEIKNSIQEAELDENDDDSGYQ